MMNDLDYTPPKKITSFKLVMIGWHKLKQTGTTGQEVHSDRPPPRKGSHHAVTRKALHVCSGSA